MEMVQELNQTINKSLSLENNNNLEVKQNDFLKSTLGVAINAGVNLGIRALLPNIIEDQVIEIKDAILNSGFKEGIKQAITSAIDLGKSAIGIFTGKFENVGQARTAIKNGGLLDNVSSLLDSAINKTTEKNIISNEVGNVIRRGKNSIIDAVNSNIENEFMSQLLSIEKISKYENNWKDYFKNKDFDGMKREFKKIKDNLKNILPIESTLKDARVIENLQTLIQNKGGDFNLSEQEIELANKLVS
jgi:hypothetical protein